MVMPGQFLERPTLIDLGGPCLEALWHRGTRSPALLILAPHPRLGGGSMDAPLCLELAFAATRRGHPTLRFNWRGVGASQGEMGKLHESIEDAHQALRVLRESAVCGGGVVVAGYGFGAEVACALAGQDGSKVAPIDGLILVAPSADACVLACQAGLRSRLCLILPERDDRLDAVLRAQLESAGVTIEVIPEADRAFSEGLVQAGEAVVRHLDQLSGPDPDFGVPLP